MPSTSEISFAARHCFNGRMIGIPPATAASKRKSFPFSRAASNSSLPSSAIRSLLAETTFLPALKASMIIVFAGSIPPITSITIWISSSSIISLQLSVRSLSSTPSLFLFLLWTSIFLISSCAPAVCSITSARFRISLYTPVPTVPRPSRPILIFFIQSPLFCCPHTVISYRIHTAAF